MSGKFTDAMKAAKAEKQKSSKDDRQIASKDEEKIVNICIKVPLSTRQDWTIEATKRNTTIKALIVEAVEEYLGEH